MKLPVCIAIFLISCLLTTTASADDSEEGWRIQFRQDTFDKVVFPIAIISQQGDDFDKALVAFACAQNGTLVAFFQLGTIMLYKESAKAEFRAGTQRLAISFASGDIVRMGRRLVATASDTAALAALFEHADGDVAFRSESKQGTFASIASRETFGILRAHCPK